MPETTVRSTDEAIGDAEKKIRRILCALEEETERSIDTVDVDMRNFAQLRVEIFLTDRRRA